MKEHLNRHGVAPETYYSHGGFGTEQDIVGFEYIEGTWYSYYTERGSKNNYRAWETEADLAAHIVEEVQDIARADGIWKD